MEARLEAFSPSCPSTLTPERSFPRMQRPLLQIQDFSDFRGWWSRSQTSNSVDKVGVAQMIVIKNEITAGPASQPTDALRTRRLWQRETLRNVGIRLSFLSVLTRTHL